MKGAGKVVSKSYFQACDAEPVEKSNTHQIQSIYSPITKYKLGTSNNVCSLWKSLRKMHKNLKESETLFHQPEMMKMVQK